MFQRSCKVRYAFIHRLPGYRFGDDGSVWSEWKRTSLGRGTGSRMYQSGEWKRLKPRINSVGRWVVTLSKKLHEIGVAGLILEAFVGPAPQRMEACHFPDRDPTNCRLDNIRWDTSRANTNDQKLHGTLVGGERHGMARLTNSQVEQIRKLGGSMSQRDLGIMFNVVQSHVSNILNNKARTVSSNSGRGL